MIPRNMSRVRRSAKLVSAAVAAVIATGLASYSSAADLDRLAGSWSGGGSVSFSTGSKERAQCRVRYAQVSSVTFAMSATCATASGRVAQSATLRKTGANNYSGRFHNPDYNTSGSISVTVRGSSQNVRLNSDSGSGVFTLRRL